MTLSDEGQMAEFEEVEFLPGPSSPCGVVRVRGMTGPGSRVFLIPEEDPSGEYWEVVVCTFADSNGCGDRVVFDEEIPVRARPGTKGFRVVGASRFMQFELEPTSPAEGTAHQAPAV